MRIDVYKDRQLVATFVPDAAPIYRGAAGQQVRALVEAPPASHNRRTRETTVSPPDRDPDRWAATILHAGLALAGFSTLGTDLPP